MLRLFPHSTARVALAIFERVTGGDFCPRTGARVVWTVRGGRRVASYPRETLARTLNLGVRTVAKAIAELRASGWVDVWRGGRRGPRYIPNGYAPAWDVVAADLPTLLTRRSWDLAPLPLTTLWSDAIREWRQTGRRVTAANLLARGEAREASSALPLQSLQPLLPASSVTSVTTVQSLHPSMGAKFAPLSPKPSEITQEPRGNLFFLGHTPWTPRPGALPGRRRHRRRP